LSLLLRTHAGDAPVLRWSPCTPADCTYAHDASIVALLSPPSPCLCSNSVPTCDSFYSLFTLLRLCVLVCPPSPLKKPRLKKSTDR
jgi:hypothetical protein